MPTLRFERLPVVGRLYSKNSVRFPHDAEYGDIVRGLPVAGASCDAVYCSHILEHLSLTDLRVALGNTYRILKPGAIFRLMVPDLEFCIEQYRAASDAEAAHRFMVETHLGHQSRQRGAMALLVAAFGNSRHLWMWDYKGLERELRAAAFERIRRAAFGDSTEPASKAAESESMWRNCLGIECRRSAKAARQPAHS